MSEDSPTNTKDGQTLQSFEAPEALQNRPPTIDIMKYKMHFSGTGDMTLEEFIDKTKVLVTALKLAPPQA